MAKLNIQGIVFDMYGTVVDVGAVAEACQAIAPDAVAFNNQWRAKQLEYTFLRSTMGKYQDFWKVTEQALEFTVHRFDLSISPGQRKHLMEAWLEPTPYPDVAGILPRLKERYPLAILSNGSPNMLKTGLDRAALRPHFRWVLSVDTVRIYKPSPRVYKLAPRAMKLQKQHILFVSSNSFDVVGAKSFGFRVCWTNRAGAPLDPLGPRPDVTVKNFEELGLRTGTGALIFAIALSLGPHLAPASDSGLISKPSKYSVPDTIERLEATIKAKGWVIFAELDHAAAAAKVGLQLRPRTVVVFGNPKLGTVPMQKAPTLAIDNPPKALVWQDDQGNVWLTYNTADYIASHVYPRHGATGSAEGFKTLQEFLDEITDRATK